MTDEREGPERYVHHYRLRPMDVEAGQVLSSVADDMPNRLSIAALSGWMLAHGFSDFKVVNDHGELGFDLYASTQEPERVRPGDWIILTPKGAWAVCPPEGFDSLYSRTD